MSLSTIHFREEGAALGAALFPDCDGATLPATLPPVFDGATETPACDCAARLAFSDAATDRETWVGDLLPPREPGCGDL